MRGQRLFLKILLLISIITILIGLLVDLSDWIVYLITIIFIPLGVLSFGFLTMAKPKEEGDELVDEPFSGY